MKKLSRIAAPAATKTSARATASRVHNQAKKLLRDGGDKMPEQVRIKLAEMSAAVERALDSSDLEGIKTRLDELQQAMIAVELHRSFAPYWRLSAAEIQRMDMDTEERRAEVTRRREQMYTRNHADNVQRDRTTARTPLSEILQLLLEHASTYGSRLWDEPRLLRAVLEDICPALKLEIRLLVDAAEKGVPQQLQSVGNTVPRRLLSGRLIQNLRNELGLAEEAAVWAVESWAVLLDALVPPPRRRR